MVVRTGESRLGQCCDGTVCGAGGRHAPIATQDMYSRSGAERLGILGARGATLSPDDICSVDAVSIAVAVHDDIDFCEVGTRIWSYERVQEARVRPWTDRRSAHAFAWVWGQGCRFFPDLGTPWTGFFLQAYPPPYTAQCV